MAHRRVVFDQVLWDVWDVRPESRAGLSADMKDGWLCFQSGSARRRLYPIPEHWDELDDPQLAELFARARRVRPIESDPASRRPAPGIGEQRAAEPSAAD